MSIFKDPANFSQIRATNNLRGLPEEEQKHIEWLFSLKLKELLHSISTMVPSTGCRPSPRHLPMLQVMYDLEKAYKFRDSVLTRIKNAFRKNRAS